LSFSSTYSFTAFMSLFLELLNPARLCKSYRPIDD
jgi:hypothetical protein